MTTVGVVAPFDPVTANERLAPYADAVALIGQEGFWEWWRQARATGGCAEPIHITGESATVRASTGEILARYGSDQEPTGHLLIPCGNRRASRCPACSRRYRDDTFHLNRAALVGGKGVPDEVRAHPKVFATFTAPSFGPVHHRLVDSDGRVRRCHSRGKVRCRQRHREGDPLLGQPLDRGDYDYQGAVIWNAMAPALWARTMIVLRREIAKAAGLTYRQFVERTRLSFGKVAEYQARGVVHFHAVIRLDGVDPTQPDRVIPPPPWATVELLDAAIRSSARHAHLTHPLADGGKRIQWGEQLDMHAITAAGGELELSDEAVAGYVAKYATKGAEAAGTVDTTIACRACRGRGVTRDDRTTLPGRDLSRICHRCQGRACVVPLDTFRVADHPRRMILTAWELGARPELASLNLRVWAHMLGFPGHFSTKSRHYSTTLTALRQARRNHQTTQLLKALDIDPSTAVHRLNFAGAHPIDDVGDQAEPDTILVLSYWRYAGRGHTPGEAILAELAARDIEENGRVARAAIRDQARG